jgi:hypothetical protein
MEELATRRHSSPRHHRAGAKRRDQVIPIPLAPSCHGDRDGRDKPGHDVVGSAPEPYRAFAQLAVLRFAASIFCQ